MTVRRLDPQQPASFAFTMVHPRKNHIARLMPDRSILIIGGVDGIGNPVRDLERFSIDADGPSLEAAVDGEPVRLRTPVELRVEPRALRLLLPERGQDVDDAAEGELLRPG